MHDRKSVAEMIGERLCEAAVLLAVFVPLDTIFQQQELTLGLSLTAAWLIGVTLTIGVILERKRSE